MLARVTLAEVDTVRSSLAQALELFRSSVLPALRAQEGYAGGYVLTTPAGQALVITFWQTREAADAGLESGFYDEQVEKFITFYKAAPGRESYDVAIADAHALAVG